MISLVLSLFSEEKMKISSFLSLENYPRISRMIPGSFLTLLYKKYPKIEPKK
jgi:hypothetical protein